MSKDFFDEEFERKMNSQDEYVNQHNGWYSPPPIQPQKKNSARPFYIAVVCIALVVCFALGWSLCILTNNSQPSDTNVLVEDAVHSLAQIVQDNYNIVIPDELINQAIEDVASNSDQIVAHNKNEQILLQAMYYLRNNYYYSDISDYQWEMAVAAAGSALLQTGGDRFSYLMTPTEYLYNRYPDLAPGTQTLTIYGNLTFGIVLNYTENVGINISEIADDSSAFGKLLPGDQIVKISNMKGGKNPRAFADSQGNPVWMFDFDAANNIQLEDVDLAYLHGIYSQLYSNYLDIGFVEEMFDGNSIVLKDMTYNQASYVLQTLYSATMHVLRDGEILEIDLVRGVTGNLSNSYDYDVVEFYFGDSLTNISTTPQNNSSISVKQHRCLDQLPADTGYIRLIQFTEDADDQMKEVLQLFEKSGLTRLVLDLKGNPGGYVNVAASIGAMFADTSYLTPDQIKQIKSSTGNNLLMTRLTNRDGTVDDYYRAPGYFNYFELPTGTTKNIVVWTDGNSASASEMLTGVILDFQTGIQMGTRTYGKGIAQTIEPLDIMGVVRDDYGEPTTYEVKDGNAKRSISQFNWAVYYTCSEYLSPLGNNIHGTGYAPTAQYDNLTTYADLVAAVAEYWK